MDQLLRSIKQILPAPVFNALSPLYHQALAFLGAALYGFPSRKLVVIGITGTKGKTSTAEILNAILESAGHRTALLGTLRFKIAERNERNLRKMTMPGRFFVQKFLADAARAKCTHAIIEMTSEGAKQFRHKWIDLDALIFTNLAPEHIESHGSFENYRDAKLSIARELGRSKKRARLMVGNADDANAHFFFEVPGVHAIPFSTTDISGYESDEAGLRFTWKDTAIATPLRGDFNARNILAAAVLARELGVPTEAIGRGVARVSSIPGRMESIDEGQPFDVIVDYAHTPDSLMAVYDAFEGYERICVLGNTGGGRDTWKRPVMGKIAAERCDHVILTNEDPYDEDPLKILREMEGGMGEKPHHVLLDRRGAIALALSLVRASTSPRKKVVLITGKGTDPYIMGPNGSRERWDDREVVAELLHAPHTTAPKKP
ncbi:MAG TPA: UDP-N-acetylmuramoyl-L-alanyl-D-glutamate--2,6-diaminopimelate ligase [Candidatus Paceibacterota bacterium]|nr:UDP-N-acetylmuramoyl-L-alanyl-D-glutamate--2,6-diaminopimelate ligase [Candidatus Paceibacterota bacterium]